MAHGKTMDLISQSRMWKVERRFTRTERETRQRDRSLRGKARIKARRAK